MRIGASGSLRAGKRATYANERTRAAGVLKQSKGHEYTRPFFHPPRKAKEEAEPSSSSSYFVFHLRVLHEQSGHELRIMISPFTPLPPRFLADTRDGRMNGRSCERGRKLRDG